MKSLTTFALITLFSLNTFAAGFFDWVRPGRPSPYDPGRGRPQVTCTASDNGWEEHWGSHRSCGECLAKHGDCIETCSIDYNVCQAEGVDYRGYKMTMEGRGDSRYRAEDEAMSLCQRRYDNCRIVSCKTSSETVSRRSCR